VQERAGTAQAKRMHVPKLVSVQPFDKCQLHTGALHC
jgi:hypothetical protein